MAWISRLKAFRLSGLCHFLAQHPLPVGAHFHGETAHLAWSIGNNTPNGPGFRTVQAFSFAEGLNKNIKLLLAQIGMYGA